MYIYIYIFLSLSLYIYIAIAIAVAIAHCPLPIVYLPFQAVLEIGLPSAGAGFQLSAAQSTVAQHSNRALD